MHRKLWDQPADSMQSKIYPRVKYLLLFCVVFLLFSCGDTERTTTPILPGEIAVLAIQFTPETVYQSYGNTYYYTVTFGEINGVGVSLRSAKIETLDSEGSVLEKDDYDERWLAETFGTSYLSPYSEVRTSVSTVCSACTSEHWLIRGIDEQGNHVETSGVVTLINRVSSTF
ncbi:hypothetical protein CSB45_02345 [candidate division KSB3 bacterium]|uniref:Uncharacterized protein n=1 Tax=candidate division KSB3 bacterium TaxID=2044937 RepID=A0A2G6E9V2_9BACT|nr:MAG: hypothetical protein CSB45_02345 [candidate division KSB3 bacterium]PIE30920.1 MAG: hypothetical protein CSA57_00955 [candidate division KSB3 bacterium]